MINGKLWKDVEGNVIHAHGGHMIKVDDTFYWYGENRTGDVFVSCYKTKDLKNFVFCNNVLTARSAVTDIGKGRDISLTKLSTNHPNENILTRRNKRGEILCNIERPKVIRSDTGKYVMWMHYENGTDYLDARCAVAVCDTPDGNFTYLGSFNPLGNMSRDCTLYKENGKVYFISAANNNADLHIYRLTDDCLDIDAHIATLFKGQFREAPALFRKDSKTYILTSGCTGWTPNQSKWAAADSIDRDYSSLKNFGDKTTFDTQPAFVLSGDNGFIYFSDRWGGQGEKYLESSYVALKIGFDDCGEPFIKYSDIADFSAL